ncbi:hypothetical protein [Streptomyces sp. NPDC059814]|uniref:hypothetical protein n=1 Tax=Streptomyces sp. NPDC059814 TaxID=3346959 RepID=UPI0036593F6A
MTCPEQYRPAVSATTPRLSVQAPAAHRTSHPDRQDQVTVAVYAADPVLHVGVVQQLRRRPEVSLLDEAEAEHAQVSLVVVGHRREQV